MGDATASVSRDVHGDSGELHPCKIDECCRHMKNHTIPVSNAKNCMPKHLQAISDHPPFDAFLMLARK